MHCGGGWCTTKREKAPDWISKRKILSCNYVYFMSFGLMFIAGN